MAGAPLSMGVSDTGVWARDSPEAWLDGLIRPGPDDVLVLKEGEDGTVWEWPRDRVGLQPGIVYENWAEWTISRRAAEAHWSSLWSLNDVYMREDDVDLISRQWRRLPRDVVDGIFAWTGPWFWTDELGDGADDVDYEEDVAPIILPPPVIDELALLMTYTRDEVDEIVQQNVEEWRVYDARVRGALGYADE